MQPQHVMSSLRCLCESLGTIRTDFISLKSYYLVRWSCFAIALYMCKRRPVLSTVVFYVIHSRHSMACAQTFPPSPTSRTSLASPTASSVTTLWNIDVSSLSSFAFRVFTNSCTVKAEAVIVTTGAIAKRLPFTNSGEGHKGYWNREISACIVYDGASLIFQNKPLVEVNGGGENKRVLGGLKVKNVVTLDWACICYCDFHRVILISSNVPAKRIHLSSRPGEVKPDYEKTNRPWSDSQLVLGWLAGTCKRHFDDQVSKRPQIINERLIINVTHKRGLLKPVPLEPVLKIYLGFCPFSTHVGAMAVEGATEMGSASTGSEPGSSVPHEALWRVPRHGKSRTPWRNVLALVPDRRCVPSLRDTLPCILV
ncbi:hypothetical protein Fmac_032766 [Flemingia macrophylla]|uniref:Uncharacterized protein n=1 Tax=Flemingia macrophylla TaxID=520843 RepID=A0ABD1L797_9FABA